MDQSNPLAKYFRISNMSTRLPSGGKFQKDGNVAFTATGEVAVMAMRAADEMMLKSPEALMSGAAVEQLLLSCVPGLKNAQELPSPDVDVLLLAIRAATYGAEMQIESECPACEHENGYTVDINMILDTVTPLENEYSVRIDDNVVVYVKPFSFRSSTQISTTVFQETRKLQLADEMGSGPDERQAQMNESYRRLHNMNIQMIAECVQKVVTPEGTVTDPRNITEYVFNIARNESALIEAKIKEINKSGVNKEHDVVCQKCNHAWTTTVEFDPASFFGQDS